MSKFIESFIKTLPTKSKRSWTPIEMLQKIWNKIKPAKQMYKGIGIVVIIGMVVFSLSMIYKVVKGVITYIKETKEKNGFK